MAGFIGTLPTQSSTQQHFFGAATTNLKGTGPADGTSPVWVPEMWSKNVLMRFRRQSIVEGITNNDYFGEISNAGDTVRIIKEPVIAIQDYSRGKILSVANVQDDEITLVLDQALAYNFKIDDLEQKLSHVNWLSMAEGSASFQMTMAHDLNVLSFYEDEMLKHMLANKAITDADHKMFVRRNAAANTTLLAAATTNALVKTALVADSFALTNVVTDAALEMSPLQLLNKLALYLNKRDVPQEGRWVVVGPEFMELLSNEDSKLIHEDYRGGSMALDNGLVSQVKLRGFSVFTTNNATEDFIMAGHQTAVTSASAMIKNEKIRSTDTFGDIIRGLHVFGRAIVRDNVITGAYITYK